MQIRQKLTYQFVFIVVVILVMFSMAIYYFSAQYRKENFYERLKSRSISVANLLIDVDEVDSVLLRKIEKDNPVSLPEEKIIVYNYLNEILYSGDNNHKFKAPPSLLDEIRLKGEYHFRQDEYEMLGLLYTSRYDRFVVVAGAIDVNGFKKLVNLRNILLIGFGVCIVIIFIGGSIYAAKALSPISNVITQVNNISANSMNLRLDEGSKKDEIEKLAETFNSMLDRLVSAFNVQKEFISNASHELRTPLTAISGHLEILLLHDRSPEFYKERISSVIEDVKNLNLTANRLLLLMQASAESSGLEFRPVRVDELLWQTRNDIININGAYQVSITFEPSLDETYLTISGNEQLIKSAFLNLVDNGCKYSDDHKTGVHLSKLEKQLIITFSDHGIGIPPDDLPQVFQPFHRGKNTAFIKGHGIGLPLVQRIMHLHKGNITIVSEQNKGTKVTISFPVGSSFT